MKKGKRFFNWFVLSSVLLVTVFSHSEAQEICHKSFLQKDFQISMEGIFINRSKSRTHLDILWKHHHSPEADTFAIYIANKDSLYYITNGDYRVLYSPKLKATRQMALHHLKEFIGKTPIRYDDLELLAKGAFLCPNESTPPNRLSTALSQMWFTLILDNMSKPESLRMFGTRGAKRQIKILEWSPFEGEELPAVIQIASNEDCGTLWIHSAYKTENLSFKDPLAEKIKKSKLPAVLDLNDKLFPYGSIIESLFTPSEETRGNGQTMLFRLPPAEFSANQEFSVAQ